MSYIVNTIAIILFLICSRIVVWFALILASCYTEGIKLIALLDKLTVPVLIKIYVTHGFFEKSCRSLVLKTFHRVKNFLWGKSAQVQNFVKSLCHLFPSQIFINGFCCFALRYIHTVIIPPS